MFFGRPEKIKRENGFTSVELMVAIILTLIITGFVYLVYSYSIKIMRTWRENMDIENTVSLCIHRITKDITSASRIVTMTDHEMNLMIDDRKTVRYQHHESRLLRNGLPMHHEKLQVISTLFRYGQSQNDFGFSDFGAAPLFERIGDKETIRKPIISVEIVIGDSLKQIKAQTSVYVRNTAHAFDTLSVGLERIGNGNNGSI